MLSTSGQSATMAHVTSDNLLNSHDEVHKEQQHRSADHNLYTKSQQELS